jgi:uncharacterized protein
MSSRLSWAILSLVGLVVCGGCSRYPFGRPPSFFFSDERVVSLCQAIHDSNLEEVRKIIDGGIELNFKGKDGMTPLLWALASKKTQAIELLLSAGANPCAEAENGASYVSYAAGMPDSSFLVLGLKHGASANFVNSSTARSLLGEAILCNCDGNVRILIERGANVNQQDPTGLTPAMMAAMQNRYDLVLYLLTNGANPTLATRGGMTLGGLIGADLENPSFLRTGEQFAARGRVIDVLEAKGVDVSNLRRLYATPPTVGR